MPRNALKILLFALLLTSVFAFIPEVFAQSPGSPSFSVFSDSLCTQKVSVGGGQPYTICSLCDLLAVFERAVDFATVLAIPVAAVMIMYGGFLIMTAGGSAERRASGGKAIQAAAIGIAITLGGWLIISEVLFALTGGRGALGLPWNRIDCGTPATLEPAGRSGGANPQTTVAGQTGPTGPITGQQCANCVNLGNFPRKPNSCAASGQGQICQVNNELNNKLAALNAKIMIDKGAGDYWWVTETFPPTGFTPQTPNGIHQNPCHGNGTCVDANLRGSALQNPAQVAYFAAKASEVGLRVEYELSGDPKTASSNTRYQQLISGGVRPENIRLVPPDPVTGRPRITGEHFSVYNK